MLYNFPPTFSIEIFRVFHGILDYIISYFSHRIFEEIYMLLKYQLSKREYYSTNRGGQLLTKTSKLLAEISLPLSSMWPRRDAAGCSSRSRLPLVRSNNARTDDATVAASPEGVEGHVYNEDEIINKETQFIVFKHIHFHSQ